MDHAEALELIELAAVEPDGLDRLMAGDTPDSGAVAGHLAGCPACVAELARTRRTAGLVREVVATQPDPALRERTLAFVREVGRDRSVPTVPAAVPEPALVAPATGAPRTRPWMRGLALVAVLALAVGFGYAIAIARGPGDQLGREVAVLQATTAASLRVAGQADARRVELVATDAGGTASGTLLYSPSSGELVMVASGLADPAAGQSYGCWVEVGGERVRIGRMYDGGDLQAWAGPVDGLGDLPADAVFGVSLVPAEGGSGTPVLTGAAQG
jgi:Anti-sigma-K factor rskA, C-terminal